MLLVVDVVRGIDVDVCGTVVVECVDGAGAGGGDEVVAGATGADVLVGGAVAVAVVLATVAVVVDLCFFLCFFLCFLCFVVLDEVVVLVVAAA